MQPSKEVLAEALLLWRYSHHEFSNNGTVPVNASVRAAFRALDVAREFGIEKEFFALLTRHPVLTVVVRELEPERRAAGKRKRK